MPQKVLLERQLNIFQVRDGSRQCMPNCMHASWQPEYNTTLAHQLQVERPEVEFRRDS
jgi:hypothetical protein